jgi:hypothetical protein
MEPPGQARVDSRVPTIVNQQLLGDTRLKSISWNSGLEGDRGDPLAVASAPSARRATGKARLLFRAAWVAVGDGPTDDEVAALRRAHRLLTAAEEAFAAKDWRRSIRAANASADLSLKVLDGRAP